MVSLSLIGLIVGALMFAYGVLSTKKKPFLILLGLAIAILSAWGAGVF